LVQLIVYHGLQSLRSSAATPEGQNVLDRLH
jgi:hypothetical protein